MTMPSALMLNPPDPSRRCAGREGRCTAESRVDLITLVPMSLIHPAAVLERAGWSVAVRDGTTPVLSDLADPDLVMVNVSPVSYASDMALVREFKDSSPANHITVTGTLPTACPEQALADGADSVLMGESEGTIEDLAQALVDGRDPAGTPGLVTRGPGGRVVHGPPRPFLDLDTLPYPARHLIDNDHYRFVFSGETYTTVLAGRGCPHPCTFCTAPLLYGPRPRYRSVEGIVEEVRYVARELGITTVAFYADTFTHDRRFVMSLCRRLEGLDVRWTCNARVDTVDSKMLGAMKAAGCRYVFYGLESGSPQMLARCRKGITPDDVRKATRLAKDAGIQVAFSAMVGLPGETRETVRETLDLVIEVDADYCSFFPATPYAGTPFHDEVIAAGHLARTDAPLDERHAAVRTEALTTEEIDELTEEAFRKFLLRPRVFAREVGKVLRERRWDEVRVGLELLRSMVVGK